MADCNKGAELTLTSGEGECEMRMCDTDGEPRGHVAEPTGHVYLARLCARPQALSMETLQGARDGLEQHRELGEELGSCLDLALQRFCREPPCVQGNARMTLSWAGGSLEFLSGDGGYTISVFYHKGNPHYYLHIKDLPGHLYVAWLRSRKERLSSNSLLALFTGLRFSQGDTAALRVCFQRAWEGFRREPQCVQDNARLRVRWGGGELEFVSGQGQCEISVLLADGEPQYHVTELGGDRPVTWSHTSPEPLRVADLARVRERLGCWRALGEELRSCFGEAIPRFSREPHCVQENARMGISWDGGTLELLSGEGQCEISVCCRDGRPQYEVGELPVHMYLARLCAHAEPLSADTLRRVLRKLGSCQEDTGILRACIAHALDQFIRPGVCRRTPGC
ncbi:hypothetical protein UY3_01361 [Chelonia mydas]|uniref:Uncharacterized protein n=1 Tax=Chelonia mydas TaxID=8469 RepID=M7CK25_CHEMY|nr:hypothetical protein UY3_01361 [Chelonia mydas]